MALPARLSELLAALAIHTRHLAIAVDDEVIPAGEFEHTFIRDGAHIEIVQPVCGG
jgi:thiamine biosynthesis protein ThiS